MHNIKASIFTNIQNYHGSLVGTRDDEEVVQMVSHVRVIGANNCRTKFAAQKRARRRTWRALCVRALACELVRFAVDLFSSERLPLCGFVKVNFAH